MASYRTHGDDHTEGRIDALDLIEGMLQDGFSLSSIRRIVQARGPNFWIGAAIGAAAVVLVTKPEARAALASVFRPADSSRHPEASTSRADTATRASTSSSAT